MLSRYVQTVGDHSATQLRTLYASPETLLTGEDTAAGDVYSFGLIALEVCTPPHSPPPSPPPPFLSRFLLFAAPTFVPGMTLP